MGGGANKPVIAMFSTANFRLELPALQSGNRHEFRKYNI
jgi:hypothetical protein